MDSEDLYERHYNESYGREAKRTHPYGPQEMGMLKLNQDVVDTNCVLPSTADIRVPKRSCVYSYKVQKPI